MQVYALFYARLMVTTAEEFVTAKKAGRGRNAIYRPVNARSQDVQDTDDASKVNAIANVDGKEHFASNVSTALYTDK